MKRKTCATKSFYRFKIRRLFTYTFLPAYYTMVPKGKDGRVEVAVKLNGYNQLALDKNEVKNPVRPTTIFSYV